MELQAKIIEKAEELFLRYGLKSVSMDDIARKLGISKKTLYQYVDNKADLISKIIMAHVEEEKAMMEEAKKNSSDAIEEMLRVARYIVQQLRKFSPALLYDLQKYYDNIWQLLQRLHLEHAYQHIKENIERGQRQSVYRQDVDAEIIAKIYVNSTLSLVDEEAFPLKKYNKEKLFIEFIKYHILGITSAKGTILYKKHVSKNKANTAVAS